MAALLDFLKKKKEIAKSKPAKKPFGTQGVPPQGKPAKVLVEKKEVEAPASAKNSGVAKKFSYDAVKQPHISEKASYLAEKDQYIFKVSPNFNKNEIKNAVEGLYKVNVLSVNMIRIPAKKRRLGRTQGWRKSYKKAVVRIKNGQKIEIL